MITDRKNNSAWHAPSLRGRVALLAVTVVVLLVFTLLILVGVLRTTQANAVARSQKHLSAVARSLAAAYETRPSGAVSLTTAQSGPLPPPPPPPAPKPEQAGVPEPKPRPPAVRPRSPQEHGLEEITAKVLQDDTGVEGGFLWAGDDRLIGYAFPTHEGPGDPSTLPARETPDIVNLASAAYNSKSLQQSEFYGPHDVVLFVAVPVCETVACAAGPSGAAWLMQRIPGAEADRRRALLWSAFGFGSIACVTVFFAFFVLRQVGAGTDAVLHRLSSMETNLEEQPHPPNVRLAEFHHVLDGLDRLALSLREQMDRERELQARVRQNERLAAIGQLAAGVAHELRNPLATIRLRAQMAQRKTQEEGTAQATGVVLAEVDRLDAIIERLLDFARPIHLQLSQTDLSSLCSAAVTRWRARCPSVDIRCIGAESNPVLLDASRMEQVLDNLIENAARQHEEVRTIHPWIQVDCSSGADRVSISVSDNAGGFTSAALKNAAEPFFTTRARGTGLGLAITQEIVHSFDGEITFQNNAEGALVRLNFPIPVR